MLVKLRAANASRVLENRTQGNRLSPFAQPHLISPAKCFSGSSTFSVELVFALAFSWERRRPAGGWEPKTGTPRRRDASAPRLRRKSFRHSRSTMDDELDVFGKVSALQHDVASEKFDH